MYSYHFWSRLTISVALDDLINEVGNSMHGRMVLLLRSG